MKNIFVEIPEDLHTAYKVECSKMKLKMKQPILQFVADFVAVRQSLKKVKR